MKMDLLSLGTSLMGTPFSATIVLVAPVMGPAHGRTAVRQAGVPRVWPPYGAPFRGPQTRDAVVYNTRRLLRPPLQASGSSWLMTAEAERIPAAASPAPPLSIPVQSPAAW